MSTFTYDVSTDIGKVRLNIGDVDTTTTTGPRSGWTMLFTDEEIDIFLTRAGSSINLASAYALRAVAANRAYLAKMVRIGDYTQDTKGLSRELLDLAKSYEDAATADDNAPAVAWVEQSVSDFAYRDIVYNDALRES